MAFEQVIPIHELVAPRAVNNRGAVSPLTRAKASKAPVSMPLAEPRQRIFRITCQTGATPGRPRTPSRRPAAASARLRWFVVITGAASRPGRHAPASAGKCPIPNGFTRMYVDEEAHQDRRRRQQDVVEEAHDHGAVGGSSPAYSASQVPAITPMLESDDHPTPKHIRDRADDGVTQTAGRPPPPGCPW